MGRELDERAVQRYRNTKYEQISTYVCTYIQTDAIPFSLSSWMRRKWEKVVSSKTISHHLLVLLK